MKLFRSNKMLTSLRDCYRSTGCQCYHAESHASIIPFVKEHGDTMGYVPFQSRSPAT